MGASSFCAGHNSRWMGRRDLLRLRGEYVALNKLRKLFIKEYLVDLNATQAAKRAGYSEKTAYSMGQRLLKNVEVQKAIEQSMEERSSRTEITQDMVLKEYANWHFLIQESYLIQMDHRRTLRSLTTTRPLLYLGWMFRKCMKGMGKIVSL